MEHSIRYVCCTLLNIIGVFISCLSDTNADVAPVYTDCHAFVMTQRREVYEDLYSALSVMTIINDRTPLPNVFYAMWLLENKQLPLGFNINVSVTVC